MKQPPVSLCLNVGSNSVKCKLFKADKPLVAVHVDGVGKEGVCTVTVGHVHTTRDVHLADYDAAVRYALHVMQENADGVEVTHVLHRVVHGGERYPEHVLVTPAVERGIDELATIAPLHNPVNLAGIRAAKAALPAAMHIAFFDTAFHHTIPAYAFLYGLPYTLYEKWRIRKYGFHGLSHEHISRVVYAKEKTADGVISCHLGSGSSICAIRHGRSIDTTMGFTPLDGLVMATRSGEIDPAIPLFLLEHEHLTPKQVSDLLNKEAGLKGLVGTADLREVKRRADEGDVQAQLAIDIVCYRIAEMIGSYHITVGGARVIAFTGGVGEHADFVRRKVCAYLEPIGVLLDEHANKRHSKVISAPSSRVTVMVIPADEEGHMVQLLLEGRFRTQG